MAVKVEVRPAEEASPEQNAAMEMMMHVAEVVETVLIAHSMKQRDSLGVMAILIAGQFPETRLNEVMGDMHTIATAAYRMREMQARLEAEARKGKAH